MNLQNIEAIYPLSPFQASLLSGDLRALDPSAYCKQMICSLHGQLDTEAFERAWHQIINQHPILRTTFAWEKLEKPVQLVHRQIDFSLIQHDWRALFPEQHQKLLDTLREAEREAGFDATKAPLMRLALCRLSDDDYYLLWSYDLVVLGDWSLPLLLEKAVAIYEGPPVEWVVEVDEMPLTPNGKIDRRALQPVEVEFEAGAGNQRVAGLAREIEAGRALGTKLQATPLVRVEQAERPPLLFAQQRFLDQTEPGSSLRNIPATVRSLFEQPIVAGLASEIEELQAPPLVRVERSERLPLSFAQQRLWFLDQLEPGRAFYNTPAPVRLGGALNIEALERTLSEVVRRHEVLRTHFISLDGEPVQVIEAAAPLKLEMLDLSGLDEAERTTETQRLVAEESARAFDLSRGPLLRVRLLRLQEDEHVALVTMHHIVSDGWSIGVLVREVAALYGAYLRGEESPLEELPIQYADFAHWQRTWLQGEVLAGQLAYWREELADAPTVIDLPIDKPRPPVQTYNGAHHPLQLSAELSTQLRELSRRHGATLFMTLLAAFDLLLCRYAGQEQVLVGTPIANRNRSETEGLIGFFVNTLVLRGDVRGNPGFGELLRQVKGTALGAYAHQDLPFEKLVEELQPERDMSRSPLFQVMFILQNAPGEVLELEGLSLSEVGSVGETAKFELTLSLQERGEVIVGGVAYNRDLYEAETIGRLAASYERVLQAVVADAAQEVFDIDLLSEAERRQIIEEWNETAAAYSRELTLSELFEAQVARTPEALALVFDDTTLSYRELNERANQLAHYLQRAGVGPEVCVGLCVERSAEMIVGVLGILKAGGAYVPLNPDHPPERLATQLTDCHSSLLITSRALNGEFAFAGESIDLQRDHALFESEPTHNPAQLATAENLVYVIYTSGSTGVSKGVAIRHQNLINYVQFILAHLGINAPLTFATVSTITADLGNTVIFPALLSGGCLHVIDYDTSMEGDLLRNYFQKASIDVLKIVPSHLGALLATQPDGSILPAKYLILGGEALTWDLLQSISRLDHTCRIVNHYGPTETTVGSLTFRVDEPGASHYSSSVPIGRPIANTRCYILDKRQRPVPVGASGELYIGGAGVAAGYLNRPAETAERFIPDPFSRDPNGRFYRTGDLARYLPDCNIEFLGRADRQVKVRGYRVELGEIEAVLASHAGVAEVVVVMKEDKSGDKRLVAYVAGEATGATLRDYLRERVPEYMVPAAFVMLERLPLTANGKVDRGALPAPDGLSLALGSGYLAPRTAVEEIVASIWGQLLGVERIGVADNFFDLGGHSLLATQVISRVRDAFGQEVALRSLFEQPTVAGLARAIEAGRGLGVELQAPPLIRVSRDEKLPLSFAQQRLWFLDQLEPGSAFYNVPAAVRLRGALNIEALERTLSEVVRRHEVLRTHFIALDGEPVQVIEAAAPMRLEVLDLSAMEEQAGEAEMLRLARIEASMPFDLSKGPLLRVSLIRLSAEEHVVLLTMHHIVSDGWSTGIFIHEVSNLYKTFIAGEESPLEELSVQYADFAHWQRTWLQGEVLAAQLAYWREELADVPTVIDLPVDKPRPPVQTYNGAHHSFELSPDLSAQLRELSRRHDSTLFMTLLAAFDLLLCRYAGQEQVLVGTPIANRNRSETEGLIGFFVNTLVLRGDVRGNPSFGELLRRVREVALGAHAHQDLPFEKLVEELQPERDLSRSALFQVTFVLQNAPGGALELPDLTLSAVPIGSTTAKFDLSLDCLEVDERIAGVLEYNVDLFAAATISRLGEHFKTLLESIVANFEKPVAELSLLSSAAETQLLFEWNEEPADFEPRFIHQLFAAQAGQNPQAIAAVFENQQLTYDELNRRANQLAQHLQALGVGPEVVVGICVERSLEMLVALLGTLKAGAAYLPLDPTHPPERLVFMVADAQVRTLLTYERLCPLLAGHEAKVICLDTDWETIAGEPDGNPASGWLSAANQAFIIYTSGSTGQPKGVMITHGGFANYIQAFNEINQITSADRVLQFHSLSFDGFVEDTYAALTSGATVVLRTEEMLSSPQVFLRQCRELDITVLTVPAAYWHELTTSSTAADWSLERLRLVIVGGEIARAEHLVTWRRLAGEKVQFANGYGPTETTVAATWYVAPTQLDGLTFASAGVPIGQPIRNLQAYVLDKHLRPVPIGVAGEIHLGGVGLARGYLNNPALTAERFIPHPFSRKAGASLYKTGDVARYLPGGDLVIIGRTDQQVKIRGFRVELGEVETALTRHSAIRECVVVAQAATSGSKRLIAYVVPAEDSATSNSELRQYLKGNLPDYMIPSAFVTLAELPLTPSGKVDRRALPEPDSAGNSLGMDFVAPRTPVEELVASIWAEVLDLERISVVDNFFDLGGHSLLATQVISRVRDAFGQEVALRQLFEYPTVDELSRSIVLAQQTDEGLEAPRITPVPRDERLPLSFAQQRLWFLDQLEPGTSFYNVPIAMRLTGQLDLEALERTLFEVTRRHEVLRTAFAVVDGEAVQIISPPSRVIQPVTDLSALSREEREAETSRFVREEAQRPFDLEHGPLLRVSLLRLGAEEHVALVTMHHIISDGWSIGVLVREVAALYGAYVRGEESPLEELPVQYADFAHWQRTWLQGEVLAAQLAYWREELADVPTVIDLPVDKPRPPVQTYNGAHHSFELSPDLSAQLRELSRRHDSTLFMTLLAAFDLLLCRYAGQEQVLVGTPIANRNRSETEGLIGFFVNTLVLRGDVRGNPSFGELLRRVREVALGAHAHQDLPFEKLVEELQPERDLSRSALFQVTFVLQNVPGGALELPGLTLSAVPIGSTTAKFDLSLDCLEVDERIAGVLEYNVDLFAAATISRLGEHFKTLLESIVANFEKPVAELSLLSSAAETQLLFEWNEEPADFEPRFIHQLFAVQAGQNPQAIAAVFENQQLTYDELNRRANQLAQHLQALGVGPEVVVGICVERSLEMLVALLGTLKAGAAYLPLDPTHPPERLVFMVADAQVRTLLTYERLCPLLAGHEAKVICLDTDWETIAGQPDGNPAANLLSAANQAFIIYTSGSTGQPKGVMITHGGFANYIQAFNEINQITSADRVLQFFSLSFDGCAEDTYAALTSGATVMLRTEEMLSSPQVFLRQCRELEITVLTLPTAYWQELTTGSTAADWSLERLRLVIVGGETILAEHLVTWRRLAGEKVQFANGYGPTETTVAATWYVAPTQLDGLTFASAGVPIGQPIRNLQAYVLDKHLRPVPIGVAGEIHLGGVGLARGYLNNPALTAERFIPHPFSRKAGASLYKTGDVARYLPGGDLVIIGRTDQQVKIRGFRVELGEVETALTRHPAIRECAVIAQAATSGSKRLIAYIVPAEDSATSNSELRQYLKGNLPDYMIPSAFVTLAELPLTPSDKVDRRALQAMKIEVEFEGESVMARTPVEEILTAIWAEVLGRETVSVYDNFFDLGGHSLLATQVISRIRDAFGQEVALRSLFEQPTVAGLARVIEAGRGLGAELQAPPLVRVERAEKLPLSFAQQRLWFLDQLEPGSAFYNIPATVRLRGALNIEALERTLSEVVRRHEVLRTHFIAIDGEPVQAIEAAAPMRLEVLDLSVLSETERTAETQRLVAEDSARPFDLMRGPLLRVSLIRLDEEEHVALVTMHHIVSDGWSIGVLVREVAALYGAYVHGEESPLEELAIQYADFAHWQRTWLQGEVLAAQLAYWREELADAPTVIDLPVDKPRPPVQTYNGAHHSFELSPDLSAQLRELSRRHDSTLFMTLLAAFDLLLCRYAGQEQVLVGTPIANRNRLETEGLIGFFVNTLVLRGDVRGNPSFGELLRRVREVALGAHAHQDLPFEKLVEELQPERDMSRSALFQVMFILQNAPGEALELEGLSLSEVESAGETAKFELTLALQERSGMIVGGVEYNFDLFEAETIGRLIASYEQVLQAVVADAEQRVLEIELLSEADRRLLLQEWNATETEYPRETCIHELFASQVANTPSQVAIVHDGEQLSYAELNARANQLAHHLRAIGVKPGSPVGICIPPSIDMVVGLLGILKAGAAYIPLDPSYPRPRLSFILNDVKALFLLTQPELLDTLPDHSAHAICLDAERQAISEQSTDEPGVFISALSPAYIIYTSGSTGQPKGVQISHRAVVNFLTAMRRQPGLNHDDVLLAVTSLSFDIAGLELYLPLITGARLVLASREETRDGALLLKKLLQSGATAMQATPTTWRLLIAAGWEGTAPLKVLCGGEALPSGLAQELTKRSAEVWNLYGPTETTVWSTVQRLDHERDVTIGRPIANTQIYLLDDHLQAVSHRVPGQLYIGGAGLAIAYLNQPALTAERFVPNPFGTDGARLYQTGDLARYRLNGEIEYLGRLDQQVKIRGFRIELGEIEAVLSSHESLREAIVVARETASGDQQLVAYVVRDNDRRTGAGEAAADESRSEQIAQWETVWDETYGQTAGQADYTFNIIGWNSSYTGSPIPAAEMHSWVDETVNRILGLSPQKVLEIGCGTGLLLFRIAPHTSHYYGTDISQRALSYIEQHLSDQRPESITLSRRPAEDFAGLEPGAFDTVILNSVAQYFPGLDYLLAVLTAAVKTVKQGSVFLGDIRNLRLLEAFHASVVLANAPPTMTAAECRRLVQERIYREEELFVDPDFFYALKQQLPEISSVEIQLKRGAYQNELTRFRYDVVLHIGRQVSEHANGQQLDWQADELSLASLQRLLKETAPASLRVTRVPNLRVARELQEVKLLADSDPASTVAEIREGLAAASAVDPEDIRALGELPHQVAITWSERETVGGFDVVFTRDCAAEIETSSGSTVSGKSLREFANDPLQGQFARKLVPTLRAYLKENLPDYMVPATFVLLDKLPLTPNSKIDRRALQAMKIELDRRGESLIEPRDVVELELAHIWEELLDLRHVGVRDDFFSLGGHSLLAVRLMARIQASFGQSLPLASLFQGATIEKQARLLREQPDHNASPLVAIQSKGEGLPFFCVHPAGGNALCYRGLSDHLGLEQPFYGIHSRGLLENQVPHTRIEDMAAYYIEDIRRVQPDGPYLLGGWSMGAVIAFEMARQLEAKGQQVSLLALISAKLWTPEEGASRWDEVGFVTDFADLLEVPLDKLKISTDELYKLDSEELLGYVLQRAIEAEVVPQDVQLAQIRRLFEVFKGNMQAMENYRPLPLSQRVTLFKDDMQETVGTPDETIWGALTSGEVEIHTVPGSAHRTMVHEPYVRTLAGQLTDCIRRAKKE